MAEEMSLHLLLLSFLLSRKRVFSKTINGHSHFINRKYPIKVLLGEGIPISKKKTPVFIP